MGQRVRRYPNPGVRYFHPDQVSHTAGRHRHAASGRGVPNGVLHQVGQHLLHPEAVDVKCRQCLRDFRLQLDRAGFGPGFEGGCNPFGDFSDVGSLDLQPQLPGLRVGQQPQVIHQAVQMQCLLVYRAQRGRIRFQQTVLQSFDMSLDVGQRRAQLVGHIGHHGAPLPL